MIFVIALVVIFVVLFLLVGSITFTKVDAPKKQKHKQYREAQRETFSEKD